MKGISIFCCLILMFIGLGFVKSHAQFDEFGRWESDVFPLSVQVDYINYSETDLMNVLTKLKDIKSEASILNDEWTGNYSAMTSELNQAEFRWSPQSGFVYLNFYTCTPALRRIDYGSVSVTPKNISLISETSKQNKQIGKYIPVKWGERHYLVDEDEISDFYKFVAGYGWKKDEDVFFSFLLKKGDFKKPVAGMPVLPKGYEKFVKKPVEAEITQVLRREIKERKLDNGSSDYDSYTFVKLNVGTAEGLKRDMFLYVEGSEYNEKIEIVRIGKHTSIGVLVRYLDELKQETFVNPWRKEVKNYPKVSVGWKLSTRSIVLINNGFSSD